MRRFTIVFLALLGACGGRPWGGDPTPRPRQQEAMQLVWGSSYGMAVEAPPVFWRTEHGCDGIAAWMETGSCVAGLFVDEHVEIAADVGLPFSETTLAHELCHAFKLATTGDGDGAHRSDCFGTHGRAEAARAALEAAGL